MREIMSHALFLWMKLMPLVCVINLVITSLALRENDLSKLEDFSTTLTVLCLNNFVACVVGAKRGGGGRKALKLSLPNPPPFFPSSLSPTPFRHLLCRLTTLAISWCCRWVWSINYVLQKIQKTPRNTLTSKQHMTNNGFCNTKHPRLC